MAVFDDILAGTQLFPVEAIIAAVDVWDELDPGTRPTLAVYLGLTDPEYASWGGPSTRIVQNKTYTTVGNAAALQAVIKARM